MTPEAKELVERLRQEVEYDRDEPNGPREITYGRVFGEAADLITQQDARIEELTRERDEARENEKATRGLLEYSEDSIARLSRKWQFQMDRADAAEAHLATICKVQADNYGDATATHIALINSCEAARSVLGGKNGR